MANFPINGKEIPEIDLRQITVSEWRAMFDQTQPEHEGDATLAKAAGMTVKEVRALPLYDYRALFKAVLDRASKPLENDEKKLAERVYLAAIDGKSVLEQIRWIISEKFGWSLEYVDALSLADLHEFLQIQDGLAHAQNSIIKKR